MAAKLSENLTASVNRQSSVGSTLSTAYSRLDALLACINRASLIKPYTSMIHYSLVTNPRLLPQKNTKNPPFSLFKQKYKIIEGNGSRDYQQAGCTLPGHQWWPWSAWTGRCLCAGGCLAAPPLGTDAGERGGGGGLGRGGGDKCTHTHTHTLTKLRCTEARLHRELEEPSDVNLTFTLACTPVNS